MPADVTPQDQERARAIVGEEIWVNAHADDPHADYDTADYDDFVGRLYEHERTILWKHIDVCGEDYARKQAATLVKFVTTALAEQRERGAQKVAEFHARHHIQRFADPERAHKLLDRVEAAIRRRDA